MNITQDSIVNSVIKKFIEKSNLGIVKYDTNLDRNDLQSIEWLNHLQEELIDGILYSEKLKKELIKLKKE
jgi:uncharacterized membrane protein YjjP (DUF1212 family)